MEFPLGIAEGWEHSGMGISKVVLLEYVLDFKSKLKDEIQIRKLAPQIYSHLPMRAQDVWVHVPLDLQVIEDGPLIW